MCIFQLLRETIDYEINYFIINVKTKVAVYERNTFCDIGTCTALEIRDNFIVYYQFDFEEWCSSGVDYRLTGVQKSYFMVYFCNLIKMFKFKELFGKRSYHYAKVC